MAAFKPSAISSTIAAIRGSLDLNSSSTSIFVGGEAPAVDGIGEQLNL